MVAAFEGLFSLTTFKHKDYLKTKKTFYSWVYLLCNNSSLKACIYYGNNTNEILATMKVIRQVTFGSLHL